ncbi:hypothetical protein J7J64_14355, partial [Lysobacter sp. ISL-42]|uniref:hypothetical protein n=1 Tax=Lysobacter sp. ISL-42 TaxID=2819152 RepID=UPI001BEA5AC3
DCFVDQGLSGSLEASSKIKRYKQDQTLNASAIERRVTFFVQSHKESNQRKGFGLFRIKSHECDADAGRSRSGHPAHGGTRRTSMCAALRVSLVSRVTSGARPKQSHDNNNSHGNGNDNDKNNSNSANSRSRSTVTVAAVAVAVAVATVSIAENIGNSHSKARGNATPTFTEPANSEQSAYLASPNNSTSANSIAPCPSPSFNSRNR